MMERGWVGTWDGGVILIIIMGEKKKEENHILFLVA